MTNDVDAKLAAAAKALHLPPQPLDDQKSDRLRNLGESLASTAIDLIETAWRVACLGGDEKEIKQQAENLDRIAGDAHEGASILRMVIVGQRGGVPPLPPRRIPRDSARVHRVPPDPGRKPGSSP
jgi:hypothetical protein